MYFYCIMFPKKKGKKKKKKNIKNDVICLYLHKVTNIYKK